jgi:hypothetical protein
MARHAQVTHMTVRYALAALLLIAGVRMLMA